MLGHASQATTQRYAHFAADPVKDAAAAIAAKIAAPMKGDAAAEVVTLPSRRPAWSPLIYRLALAPLSLQFLNRGQDSTPHRGAADVTIIEEPIGPAGSKGAASSPRPSIIGDHCQNVRCPPGLE
jgi:hypothetical protein